METALEYRTKQQAEILARLKENLRVSMIRVAAPEECSVGLSIQGVYSKENAPALPVIGCSRPGGCICTYEPVLNDIYP
jgi:hypothetical protein